MKLDATAELNKSTEEEKSFSAGDFTNSSESKEVLSNVLSPTNCCMTKAQSQLKYPKDISHRLLFLQIFLVTSFSAQMFKNINSISYRAIEFTLVNIDRVGFEKFTNLYIIYERLFTPTECQNSPYKFNNSFIL